SARSGAGSPAGPVRVSPAKTSAAMSRSAGVLASSGLTRSTGPLSLSTSVPPSAGSLRGPPPWLSSSTTAAAQTTIATAASRERRRRTAAVRAVLDTGLARDAHADQGDGDEDRDQHDRGVEERPLHAAAGAEDGRRLTAEGGAEAGALRLEHEH